MPKKYNGLNSIKVDLAAIGICPDCGRRFTDPLCPHATPDQIKLTKKIDLQVEAEYAAKKIFRNRTISTAPWTSYTPSKIELSKRSYKGRHVPDHFCPRCNLPLIVNEKEYKTIDPDAPHYERRLVCSGFFTNGCSYKEPWTNEIQEILNRPIEVDVDF